VSILLLMAAALFCGLFLGCVLTHSYISTQVSRSQERMQRKIRYWQAEAARAREAAEQITRELTMPGN
jgi:hypothetical protein